MVGRWRGRVDDEMVVGGEEGAYVRGVRLRPVGCFYSRTLVGERGCIGSCSIRQVGQACEGGGVD